MSNEVQEETVEVTAQQIGETLTNINECLRVLAERLKKVEAYVSELPTPAKTYYKPEGYEDYMNLGENFTELYKKVGELEKTALRKTKRSEK